MKKKEEFQTSIGGQALIEGIYMRSPSMTCLAVRKPDGEIFLETDQISPSKISNIPFVRGAYSVIDSMIKGYRFIMKSADIAIEEELEIKEGEGEAEEPKKESKMDDKTFTVIGAISAVLGGLLAVVLFMIVPTFLTGLVGKLMPLNGWQAAVEGLLKIVIFVLYLFLVTRMKDIRRVFEYHGAEHKSIACYEARAELTVENVREYPRFHPRCGTSYLFLVLIISIAIFSFVPFTNTLLRAGIKLLMIPVIMSIAYEALRYAGKHSNIIAKVLSYPGLLVQRLTAFEPDDDQIEVALAALKQVIPEDGEV
ncbi:MAG: DUF1385 domain-containing protein [Oscillospiraceae bacterium]|nr:DUF1385 domain-containing protein [Oscillospiraceae bacterium]